MSSDDSDLTKTRFGQAIKKRREELGISQEQLALRADLHRTYISDVERGERNPSLTTITRLTAALEITVSELFSNYGIEEKV